MIFPLALAAQLLFDTSTPMTIRGDGTMIRGQSGVGSARIDVLKKGETPYVCEVTTPPSVIAVKKGDALYLTYEARCTTAANESQTGSWNLRVQRPETPYDGPFDAAGSAGKTWRRFHGAFRADRDYPAGKLVLTFHVATQVQSLEFRDLKCLDYGPDVDPATFPVNKLSYEGQDPKAPWRLKAAAMLEKNRKADLEIHTKPGTLVHVKMLRHAYPFATVTGVDPQRTDADAAKFFEFMKGNFSRLTVPVYWTDWGWESTEVRTRYLQNLLWCEKNGYRMKAHNLIWPSYKWAPKRVQTLAPDELQKEVSLALDARIAALKGFKFEAIDVVNELISEHDFEDKIGLDFAVEAFKKAHASWPSADLVYNDYLVQDGDGVNPKYLAYARKLKAMGAPISLLGFQAHFAESLPSITWVWTLLDTAKRETGLPVEITEFDLNTRDDQAQADFTRDLLTAWFAHPQSRGFTMWGFWEGDHWIPPAAMIRKDWTLRPAARVWQDLVTKTWWTDVTVRADAKGFARVRGFKGDYELSSGTKRKRITLHARLAVKL